MHLNAENLALAQQAEEDNFKLLTVNVDVNGYPPLKIRNVMPCTRSRHFLNI